MSSAWTMLSPSMVAAGPGGCLTDVVTASNRARVSAGEAPLSAEMSLAWSLERLNPDRSSLGKNAADHRPDIHFPSLLFRGDARRIASERSATISRDGRMRSLPDVREAPRGLLL